jgi:hypothetical protein
MQASAVMPASAVETPRKRKFSEEDIAIDSGGGVRRRMERMSISVESDEGRVQKK